MELSPGSVGLDGLIRVLRGAVPTLDRRCRPGVERAAGVIARAASGAEPVYGVNTGFGKLATVRIPPADTERLQRNLILSHAAGVGPPLAPDVVKLVMALKLISLGRGASGVRWALLEMLEAMLARDVVPIIPAQGSVGASGDLAPLAHLTAVMIGEGEATHGGHRMPGGAALAAAGLEPLILGPKEGLAMINGTQVSTALALAGVSGAWEVARAALVTGAMATDAAMGSPSPFRPEIQALRGLAGQIEAGAALRGLLHGSEIRESHREGDERVQDPYCVRCQPQVMGACLDALRRAAKVLETEANAVTDNPLVVGDEILSGGNFHAEPVAMAADQVAVALAEIGSITQRRIALLVDPALSFGLPAFLTPEPGLNSGFMIAEVTSAALMAENKALANPRSVDSTPTSANQEDHVSMACHAARRLEEMVANLRRIVAIEALAAAQGTEMRAPLRTSPRLAAAIDAVRRVSPALTDDRLVARDIDAVTEIVSNGTLVAAADPEGLPEIAG